MMAKILKFAPKYIAVKDNIFADILSHSHASLKETTGDIAEKELEAQLHMVYKNAQATSATMKKIQEGKPKDSYLTRFARHVTEGWPTKRDQIPADVKPYW